MPKAKPLTGWRGKLANCHTEANQLHTTLLKAFEPQQHDVAEAQRVWENESAVWFVCRPKIVVGLCYHKLLVHSAQAWL